MTITMKRLLLISAFLILPIVALTQNTDKIRVYQRCFKTVTHYDKVRGKPYWLDVTVDSATRISVEEAKHCLLISVSFDSLAMSVSVEKNLYRKCDTLKVYLRPSVARPDNVFVQAALSNSIVTGPVIQLATVPCHEVFFTFSNKKTYNKIVRKFRHKQ